MKNKIQLDSQTLLALSDDLRKKMSPVFDELRHEIQSENFGELSKWYMKSGITKANPTSEIANKIVEKITECLPQNYIQLAINNINISSHSEKPGVTFDLKYNLDPLKFYVEFLVRISGQYITSGRVRFEIHTNGIFKELKFQRDKKKEGKIMFCFGRIEANIGISLVGLPFVKSIEPHEIVSRQFEVDLSKYSI